MEFYISLYLEQREFLLFQFPTGWNSTLQKCFDSTCKSQFQFPTGWNSTRIMQIGMHQQVVSIPNGMEFYNLPNPQACKSYDSFNSQRDGILLSLSRVCLRSISSVSIPNGMEFYVSAMIEFIHLRMFQFPTGWNSTFAWYLCRLLQVVSIPNGMEFYFMQCLHRNLF